MRAPRTKGAARPHPSLGPTLLAAIALLAVVASACGSGSDAATKSDPADARQLAAAASAMQQATGYRFDAAVGAKVAAVDVTGEFQAPDRLHETVSVGGRPSAEVVFIGTKAFVKDPATGAWRDRVQGQDASTATDVRSAFGALGDARDVSRTDDGRYHFTIPAAATRTLVGPNATGTVRGTATLAGNSVVELSYGATVNGKPVAFRITYSDIGSAPPVEQPTPS
jgi:hypothetical protein